MIVSRGFIVLSLGFRVFASEEKIESNEDIDFDPEFDAAEDPATSFARDEAAAQAIDGDLTIEERRRRMHACLEIVRETIASPNDKAVAYIEKFTEGLGGAISPQQALEYVHMDFLKNCYLTIQAEDVSLFRGVEEGGKDKWVKENSEKFVYPTGVAATIRSLHKSQWDILSEILKSETKDKKKRLSREVLGGTMSAPSKIFYMIGVLAVVFGSGYWVLLQLTKAERARVEKRETKKSKKSTKKD